MTYRSGWDDTHFMTVLTVPVVTLSNDGQIVDHVGFATRVRPDLLLVHPPLSEQLAGAGGEATQRYGVLDNDADHPVPVHGILVANDDDGPLVALDLASNPLAGPVLPIRSTGDAAELASALRRHLEEPTLVVSLTILDAPDDEGPETGVPWCKVFPHAWMCPDAVDLD